MSLAFTVNEAPKNAHTSNHPAYLYALTPAKTA